MSKNFNDVNRLMRTNIEFIKREQSNQIRRDRQRQALIDEALEDLEAAFENTEERAENRAKFVDGATQEFDEMLLSEAQLRFDSRFMNDEREDTLVAFVLAGVVIGKDKKKRYLYETIVQGAPKMPKGRDRNKRDPETKMKAKKTVSFK